MARKYIEEGVVEFTADANGDSVYLQADGNDLVAITDIDEDGWGTVTVHSSSDPHATAQYQGRINVRERRVQDEDPTSWWKFARDRPEQYEEWRHETQNQETLLGFREWLENRELMNRG